MLPSLTAAAILGLASIPHCAAMCGPVAVHAGSGPRSAWGYHLGRALAYASLGALAGAFGASLTGLVPTRVASALLSWTLAGTLGWTAFQLWSRSTAEQAAPLVTLNAAPRRPSLSDRLFANMPKHPVALGLLTGALPCGALYSALLVAASAGQPWGGAAAMFTFAVSSALGLVLMGAVARQVAARIERGHDAQALRRVLAVGLMVGAVVLFVRPIAAFSEPEHPPACHVPR